MPSRFPIPAATIFLALSSLALADPPAATTAPPNPATSISQDRLTEHLRSLPLKRSGWKDTEHREGLQRTEALIADHLKALGYTPVLHEIGAFSGRGEPATPRGQLPADSKPEAAPPAPPAPAPITWHNIIADIPGQSLPGEIVILGAHFDAVPFCPGADDNGSGAAALLEIARVLKDSKPHRTIRLAFFNLEEVQPLGMGLIGSAAYAADLAKELQAGRAGAKVVGMISMDTIGYFSDEPNSQVWPPLPVKIPLPKVGNFIAVGGLLQYQPFSQPLIKAMRAAVEADKKEGVKQLIVFGGDILPFAAPDFLRSDHAPFLAMGIPSVIISDTANFRSPHYHRRSDTIETIDMPRYVQTVRAIAAGVYEVAGRADLPSAPPLSPEPKPAPAPPPPHPEQAPEAAPAGSLPPLPGQAPEKPR